MASAPRPQIRRRLSPNVRLEDLSDSSEEEDERDRTPPGRPQIRRRLGPDVRIEDLSDSDRESESDSDGGSSAGDEEQTNVGNSETDSEGPLEDSASQADASSDTGADSDYSGSESSLSSSSSHKYGRRRAVKPVVIASPARTSARLANSPKGANNLASTSDDDASSTATLLSLPDELLITLVSFMGRSPSHPLATPWQLFRSCRRLYLLSKDRMTRIEFLSRTYGAVDILERCWSWLRLLSDDILDTLLQRAAAASSLTVPPSKVPRYVLQRLARRCDHAKRTDLQRVVLQFAKDLYPAPTPASGPNLQGQYGLGFDHKESDEYIFDDLLSKDTVPAEFLHLLEDARQGGWNTPEDPAFSALLTLKHKYAFDVNFLVAGWASPSKMRYWSDSHLSRHPGTDVGVEGINHGFLRLTHDITYNHEAPVRRLLRLGVHLDWCHGAGSEFLAASIACARRNVPDLALPTDPFYKPVRWYGPRDSIEANTNTNTAEQIWSQLFSPSATAHFDLAGLLASNGNMWPGDEAILMAQGKRYTGNFYTTWHKTALQAMFYFTPKPSMMTLVLDHAAETEDKMMVVRRLWQVWTSPEVTAAAGGEQDFELCWALCNADLVKAQACLDNGDRLTVGELVAFLHGGDHFNEAREFLNQNYPFTKDTLCSLLIDFMLADRYGSKFERHLETARMFFEAHRDIIDEETERTVVLAWFMRSNSSSEEDKRRGKIRPLLGALRPDDPEPLFHFDLRAAIIAKDADEINRLIVMGVRVPADRITTFFTRFDPNNLFTDFITRQNYSAKDLGRIVAAHPRPHWAIANWVIDGPVKPFVDWHVLSSCMKNTTAPPALPTFKKLLEIAKQQARKVEKAGVIRNMVKKRGGEWVTAFEAYEAAFR